MTEVNENEVHEGRKNAIEINTHFARRSGLHAMKTEKRYYSRVQLSTVLFFNFRPFHEMTPIYVYASVGLCEDALITEKTHS